MTDFDKVWERFMWLLTLQLHDGNECSAKERPQKVLLGSVASHKKVFDQAVKDVENDHS